MKYSLFLSPKKYFIYLVIIFILPTVTFASWWNPFTWVIFSRSQPTVPLKMIEIVATTTSTKVVVPPSVQIIETSTTSSSLIQIKPANTIATSTQINTKLINPLASSSSATILPNKNKNATTEVDISRDWGKVKSYFGFSMKYPYKTVGAAWGEGGEIGFYFDPTPITHDATTSLNMQYDFESLKIQDQLTIMTIEATTTSGELEKWATAYLHKEDAGYGNKEKLISQDIASTNIGGVNGVMFSRKILDTVDTQTSHYLRKERFIVKGKYIYRARSLAPSEDTVFPRTGSIGKRYLQYIDETSIKILNTIVFDGSKIMSVSVPRTSAPVPTGAALQKLKEHLATLRVGPYFNEHEAYPSSTQEYCTPPSTSGSASVTQTLTPAPGIYVAGDDKLADLHVYDAEGWHTGPLPDVLGYGGFFRHSEQGVRSANMINLGSSGIGLSIDENIDGKIVLTGKKYGEFFLEFRGDGNSCLIASIPIFVTPYSVATIPMTKKGDLGPISYDIDGDGVEDLVISMIHPILPEKVIELNGVLDDLNVFANQRFVQFAQ